MNTATQVDLDIESLLAEAQEFLDNRKAPVKKPQAKKTQTQKTLERKPVIQEPVILPKPVALVNTYVEMTCTCGKCYTFLQAQRIKLIHTGKGSSRREEYSALVGWENYKELSSLPEEKRIQQIRALTCPDCGE